MRRPSSRRAKLLRWQSDRIGDWVASELARTTRVTDEWYEDLRDRSAARFGRIVPVLTLKAYVHAIERRAARAALKGDA